MRQVYPEDGGQLSFAEALIHLALPPLPLPSPAAPACRRGPDGSLTIAVEKLEPVVNPVIGLFAVGFLGCIRTQRHKRRRREVGVSKWTDFEATFPILASGAGAEQAREQQKLRPTVIPLPPPAPNPTLTAPSPLPENSMRRSQEIPFPWGLGPGPAEAGATRGGVDEGGFLPGASGSGVRSRARLSPIPGPPRELFQSRTSRTRSPCSPRAESGLGDPGQECVVDALHWRRSAPPEAPGPAPRPGATGSGAAPTYFFLLHEPHKGCPLDLHRLALSVVEGQDEVEEVGFPQIGRRLLLKVSPGQTHPAVAKDAELDG